MNPKILRLCFFAFLVLVIEAHVCLGFIITERFGGTAPTLDHPNVMRHVWFGYHQGNVHMDSAALYHERGSPHEKAKSSARRNAIHIDLRVIPPGSHILKAQYVMPYDRSIFPFTQISYKKGLSMYKLLDPSGTGMWEAKHLSVRQKNTKKNIPWTKGGGTFANCVAPNPITTVYGNGMGRGKKLFFFFDMTNLVQDWVDHPAHNLGITFDGTVPSDKIKDPFFRPFLEITYETEIPPEAPPQPKNLTVFHRSGQTFLTWAKPSYDGAFYDMRYKIYRHDQPITEDNLGQAAHIGEVNHLSGYNARRSEVLKEPHFYVIEDGKSELSEDTGLFVYTVKNEGEFHYAVTSVKEGNENRTDFSADNRLKTPVAEKADFPGAVCQRSFKHKGNQIREFVHWADESMSYKAGHGFNFMINVPPSYRPDIPMAIEVSLGGRGTSYYGKWCNPQMITIRPDDYMPPTPSCPYDGTQQDNLQSWWAGCRDNYKTQTKRSQGTFVPYTENRVLFCISYVRRKYQVDENRIYLRGNSMGGTGAMSLGLKHPEIFASVRSTVGCPNWRLNIHGVDPNYKVVRSGWRGHGYQLWGSQKENIRHENGIPIWDWMNAGWYALNHIGKDMPFLSLANGKKDGSIQFFALPQFYADMKTSRHGFTALFYDGGHSGWDSPFGPRFGTIVRNESFPALRNVSIDGNPGKIHQETGMAMITDFKKALPVFDGDPKGEINGYTSIEWSRQRYPFDSGPGDDMVDLPDRYELALRLGKKCPESSATADITPRRLQRFRPLSGETYRWENKRLSTGEIIQSGTVTADSYGLLTIPKFVIEKTKLGNKLILMRQPGSQSVDEK